MGPSPTPALEGPGVFAPRSSHPFHCDGTLQFPEPIQTLCGGPVFSFLHGGEAGGAPRGSVTASVEPGLLPRTDVQRRALPSLPRPSGKKHSLLPNQSPQYPRPTARWIMVFDLILRSLLAGTELATPKGAFPLPVPIHPLQPGCQDSLTSSPTVFDH